MGSLNQLVFNEWRNVTRVTRVLLLATAITITFSGCGSTPTGDAKQSLILAAVPQDQAEPVSETYALLIDLLEEELNLEIDFYPATDRAAIIEGLAADRIDVAIIDSYGYVLSKQRTDNLELVGVISRGLDTPPGYWSLGVARSDDTSISSLADAMGKTVCFVDPASTGGYLFPAKGLIDVGIDPKPETTSDIIPVFAGAVSSAGIAVVENECDLGFIADSVLSSAISKGDIPKDSLKTVWKSELIPAVPMVINTKLSKSLRSSISNLVLKSANKTAFVNAGACISEQTCKFMIPSLWGFVAASENSFDPIRDACAALGNSRCE